MADVAKLWADASLELKQKYQNAIFPKGFILDIQNDNFIISEISPLYSLVSNAIDPLKAKNSIMVTLKPATYRVIAKEIMRWNEILQGIYTFNILTA